MRPVLRFFFFQAEDGIRDGRVTGVQTCALPISGRGARRAAVGAEAGGAAPPLPGARRGGRGVARADRIGAGDLRGGGMQAPDRAHTRLGVAVATVALAIALALAPLASTRAPRAPLAWLGAVAVLLAAGAAWRFVSLAGVAV